MISLRKSANDLERLDDLKRAALNSYSLAISATNECAIEVDRDQIADFRSSLQALVGQLESADTPAHLRSIDTAFRQELKDYKKGAENIILQLREDVDAAALAMEAFTGNISAGAVDYEVELKREIKKLNAASAANDIDEIRRAIRTATSIIAGSFEQLRLSNEATIADLRDEIRRLQKQVHSDARVRVEEKAGEPVRNPQVVTEAVRQIDALLKQPASFPVVLAVVRNVTGLEIVHTQAIVEVALNSLLMRFRGLAGERAKSWRLSNDRFIAILDAAPASSIALSREIAEKLSQAYIVHDQGKTHTLAMQVRAGVMDHRAGSDPSKFYSRLDRLAEALTS